MPFFTSPIDGARLHYTDYRPASTPSPFKPASKPSKDLSASKITLVFIHGWPMSSRMYEHLMLPLCENNRIRCVASDRRGFGKSQWTGSTSAGDITYDTLARDTVALVEQLYLAEEDGGFVFVAASMGCAETLLAYQIMSQELKRKCKGMIWLGPSCPYPLKTEAHPEGPPRELWDAILQGFRADRVGFVKAAIPGVFGMGPQFDMGIEVPETMLQRFEQIVWDADALAVERCVMMITERDFTEELKALNGMRLLVLHGDSDQGMPASMSANLIGEYVKLAEVKIFEKAAHGLYLTHAEKLLEDIVGFVGQL